MSEKFTEIFGYYFTVEMLGSSPIRRQITVDCEEQMQGIFDLWLEDYRNKIIREITENLAKEMFLRQARVHVHEDDKESPESRWANGTAYNSLWIHEASELMKEHYTDDNE